MQLVSLKDNEKMWVMDQLAHKMNVDVYYRMLRSTLMCTKIGKLLKCLEDGRIEKFKGKKLDEIEDDIPIPLEGEDDQDDVDMQVHSEKRMKKG